jgi:hypothetical protein
MNDTVAFTVASGGTLAIGYNMDSQDGYLLEGYPIQEGYVLSGFTVSNGITLDVNEFGSAIGMRIPIDVWSFSPPTA